MKKIIKTLKKIKIAKNKTKMKTEFKTKTKMENKILKNTKGQNIPNLDESVISALEFFKKENLAFPNKLFTKIPIIIGSGNAYNTAKILFKDSSAIFANESNFKKLLKGFNSLIKKGLIKEALIISASGEKDSVWEVELAKKAGLKTILFSCNYNSNAEKLADKTFVFKKLPEPYTYNVSTYLGMILAFEKESPAEILKTIKSLSFPKKFANYKAYSFVLPDEFGELAPMLEIKRHELFGPKLSLRAFSEGEARHAKFVIPWKEELVISFAKNEHFGEKESRFEIKLRKKLSASLLMAISYFIIGKIQESKPAYFKNNIKNYCLKGGKAYGKGEKFSVIS